MNTRNISVGSRWATAAGSLLGALFASAAWSQSLPSLLDPTVTQVAAGGAHSCALTTSGGVQCWGGNSFGQLGDGTRTNALTPVAVAGLSRNVVAIAGGGFHTCALIATTGAVQCWGQNVWGQLGDGTTTDSSTPVTVSGLAAGAIAISAGGFHTCALLSTGAVQCWGQNQYGQLGNGSTTGSPTPVTVSGLASGVVAIATGVSHSCGLSQAGAVQCWGRNQFGQLGGGSTSNSSTPVTVANLAAAVQIATGANHTCAVAGAGVQCWGSNNNGQLGNGTTTDSTSPVAPNGLGGGMVAVAAGSGHSCALAISGTVQCWGTNSARQLGDGTMNNSSTPVATTVLTTGALAVGAQALVAGSNHNCALTVGGGVQCWGSNSSGQLGINASLNTPTPTAVVGLSTAVAYAMRNAILGGRSIRVPLGTLAAGHAHTCGVTTAGGVQCWGLNDYEQLGNITGSSSTPIAVAGLTSSVAEIAVGADHNCARTVSALGATTGAVLCWGSNTYGELGQAAFIGVNSATPLAVDTLGSGVVAVTAGAQHSCALIYGTNVVKCWGRNDLGQLGNGTASSSPTPNPTPVMVSGLNTVIALASGDSHTCALLNGGTVTCWGRTDEGQLGNGSFTRVSYAPVAVSGLSNVVAIAAGGYHSCALTSAGAAYCWGFNQYGELGNGTFTNSATPVQVSGLDSGVAAIAAGAVHSCALMSTGAVRCWGFNSKGQLGTGTNAGSATPVAVANLAGAAAITGGDAHTCAVTAAGGVRCWGDNSSGQLGNGTTLGVTAPVAARAGQTLGFATPAAFTVGTTLNLSASATGTVAFDTWPMFGMCGVSGTQLTAIKPGLCGVRASVAGYTAASGDNFAPAAQQLRLIRILAATPTLTLSTSGSPSAPGARVMFTTNLAGAVTATGVVSVCADAATPDATCSTGTLVCSAPTSGTQSVCSTTALAPGPHTITAYFAGDDYNAPAATTSALNQFVGSAPAITSANAATFTIAQVGGFTVNASGAPTPSLALAPTDTLPSGVHFLDIGNGTASLAGIPASGSVGTYTLHVTAHSAVAPDAVQTFTLSVQKASSSITINSASPASAVYGQSVSLSATLSSANGQAGGTVSFFYRDGFNTQVPGCINVPMVGGQAQCATTKLVLGSHSIIASYSGDADTEDAASSNSADYTVTKAATAVTLTPPATATLGNSIAINAAIAVVAPGAGTLSGTIAIDVGSDSCSIVLPATSCTLTPSSAGSKSLTAVYTPDAAASAYFSGSSAAPATLTVNAAAVTAVLSSSVNPSVFGQAVTLTGTLAPTSATATPTTGSGVHFLVDGAEVCAGSTLSPAGGANAVVVSCSVPQASLGVGNHVVQFQYLGDAGNQAASANLPGGQTVAAADTTLSIGSLAPIVLGQAANVSVHVIAKAPGAGTPTGSVAVSDGAATCTATLVNGDGSCVLTPMTAGATTVTATYTPDAAASGFNSSNASTGLAVSAAPSTATLTSSVNPSVFGQSVTFTVTIAGTGSIMAPMGMVTFFDAGIARCGPVPVLPGLGSSTVSCAAPALAGGHHAITATYSGDTNYQSATTAALDQAVNAAATALTLTPPAAIALGNSVSVSATVAAVAPGAGTPTGTITIGDGGAGAGDNCTITLPATSCSLTPGGAGMKNLTATYAPDAAASGNFAGSSASGSLSVSAAVSGTALASSANPSVFGQSVMFTATVTPASGGVLPTGTVAFRDGATVVCASAALSAGSGNAAASCTTSSLAVGTHAIVAAYSGDANNQASSATLAGGQIVDAAATTTTLAPLSPVAFGTSVNVQVNVAAQAPGAGMPAGTVAVSDGAASCVATLANGSGSCSLTPPLRAGTHTLTAVYTATTDFAASSGSASLSVGMAASQVALTAAPSTTVFGQAATFTATVTSANAALSGTVAFSANGTALGGCAAIALSAGKAACTTAALAVGAQTITATYSGDADTAGASAPTLAFSVTKAATTTTLTPPASITFGATVDIAAAVAVAAPGAGTPTGTIAIDDGSGARCTIALPATRCTLTPASAGTKTLTATYVPDAAATADFTGSSASGSLVVNASASGLTLISSANPSVFGQNVTFTAMLPNGTTAPTGSVGFNDGATVLCAAVALVPVASGASASCTTSALAVGDHMIRAAYSGDANHQPANVALTQTVGAAATTLSLSAPASVALGQVATMTAHLAVTAPGAGTPSGSIVVGDGSASCSIVLPATSCSLQTAGVGTRTLTASYAGDGSFRASSATASMNVFSSLNSVTLTSTPNPSKLGQTVTFTAVVSTAEAGGGSAQGAAHSAAAAAIAAAPTGVVTFHDGRTTLATVTLDANGRATYATDALSLGTHAISANYSDVYGNALAAGNGMQQVDPAIAAVAVPAPALSLSMLILLALVCVGVAAIRARR